jgi:hypothetical protein
MAKLRQNIEDEKAAAPNHDLYRVSKSGKKLPIQIGSRWFEDFDQDEYIPLIVLAEAIPEGEPGYVRSDNVLRKVRKLMRHARFGVCPQIEGILPVGQGLKGVREHTTYLLNKFQSDVLAAALGDMYLMFLADRRHANLSDAEKEMAVSTYMSHVKHQATEMLDTAVKTETPEQTTARLDTIDAIDAELDAWNDIRDQLPTDLELAEMQLAAIESLTTDPDKLNKHPVYCSIKEAVQHVARIRDMTDTLLNSSHPAMEDAGKRAFDMSGLVLSVNMSMEILSKFAKTCETYDIAMQCHPYNNSPFVYDKYDVEIDSKKHMTLMYYLKRDRILSKLPQDPKGQYIHDEVIEFGIYTTLYGLMGDGERESVTMANFRQKYKLTRDQILRIAVLMETTLGLRKQNMSMLIVEKEKRSRTRWYIHSVSR